MATKVCTVCEEAKEATTEFFYADKRNKDGIWARCKLCMIDYRAQAKVKDRKKSYNKSNPKRTMLWAAKVRAKKQGVPFDLTVDDFDIPEVCPVLGITIAVNDKCVGPNSPSLDKIIPELGYVPGNVQVMSYKANAMKQDATPAELLAFAEWILKGYGN